MTVANIPYPKIDNVYRRDPTRKDRVQLGVWTHPVLEYLAPADWIWLEKIDGMNIRVSYQEPLVHGDEGRVLLQGRTDNAQLPGRLRQRLEELFPLEKMREKFSTDVTLYGEGYGVGIQPLGAAYLPDRQDFILFDVRVGDCWLERENVAQVAEALGCAVVPEISRGPLAAAVALVAHGFESRIAQAPGTPAEGLIVHPRIALERRGGGRVIAKIKTCDFPRSIPDEVALPKAA